jgi:hypothetical protein
MWYPTNWHICGPAAYHRCRDLCEDGRLRTSWVVALKRLPNARTHTSNQVDIRAAIVEFKTTCERWQGYQPGMTIDVKHHKHDALPEYLTATIVPRASLKDLAAHDGSWVEDGPDGPVAPSGAGDTAAPADGAGKGITNAATEALSAAIGEQAEAEANTTAGVPTAGHGEGEGAPAGEPAGPSATSTVARHAGGEPGDGDRVKRPVADGHDGKPPIGMLEQRGAGQAHWHGASPGEGMRLEAVPCSAAATATAEHMLAVGQDGSAAACITDSAKAYAPTDGDVLSVGGVAAVEDAAVVVVGQGEDAVLALKHGNLPASKAVGEGCKGSFDSPSKRPGPILAGGIAVAKRQKSSSSVADTCEGCETHSAHR